MVYKKAYSKKCIFSRRLLKSKKADFNTEEILEQIPYIVLTAMVIVGIYFIVDYYVNLSVNVRSLEFEVLTSRILYSPNSVMYTDNFSGTVFPGIIELANFTDQTLDNAIQYTGDRHIPAKLEIYDADRRLVKAAYVDKLTYQHLEPLAASKIQGASSGELYVRTLPVVFRINNINQPGFLRIQAIIPN